MMENKYKLIFITFSLCVTWLVPFQWLKAGDEDMMSPYTQFDPETGFFIPIDPQSVDPMTQGHEQNSGSKTSSTAQVPAPTDLDEELPLTSSGSQSHIIIISGIVLLLIAGAVYYFRRAKDNVGQ
jgi:LPXTG-motif cell wall-anchored protein